MAVKTVAHIPHCNKSAERNPLKAEPEKFTLAEAFDYFHIPEKDDPTSTSVNNERCVRAVAFLLQYSSDFGNEAVDGVIADGLARVLAKCASDLDYTQRVGAWKRQMAEEIARG